MLHDFPASDGGQSFERNTRRGLQAVADSGRLTGDIEFVHTFGLGLPLPGGSTRNVEQAFAELPRTTSPWCSGPRSPTTR